MVLFLMGNVSIDLHCITHCSGVFIHGSNYLTFAGVSKLPQSYFFSSSSSQRCSNENVIEKWLRRREYRSGPNYQWEY